MHRGAACFAGLLTRRRQIASPLKTLAYIGRFEPKSPISIRNSDIFKGSLEGGLKFLEPLCQMSAPRNFRGEQLIFFGEFCRQVLHSRGGILESAA